MIKPREEVAKVTIARMAIYYSILKKIRDEGEQVCASTQLSKLTGIASSVIRRDLAYFGGFGTKGVGYEVEYLLSWVGEILGYNAVWNSVLVGRGVPFTGVGNYDRLLPPGFKIAAVVDLDKRSHGHKIPGLGLTVNRPGNLANLIKSQAILIGLLTVPTQEAREWQIPWLRQV
ncbi:redox-sensing transcriptional repressor Rex [Sporomusa sp.]|uniref:redox-sensing transcriptional repressor Rex n=1 Tax=Sporomusa sp. TaxID=2078658 RepID=UPI002BB805B8|nr:redox-sensing transcriptional repressor Rex [Sporomusa sp.]HWR06600.1 redox-sensing transcriptional repressor Rex [Sporomusa sp.]